MLMDGGACILCTVPIIVPLFKMLGIDLIYFGVIVCLLMSIGTLTPPVGTCMFVICKMTGMPIERWTKVMIPWLLLLIGLVVLFVFVPPIISFLPGLL